MREYVATRELVRNWKLAVTTPELMSWDNTMYGHTPRTTLVTPAKWHTAVPGFSVSAVKSVLEGPDHFASLMARAKLASTRIRLCDRGRGDRPQRTVVEVTLSINLYIRSGSASQPCIHFLHRHPNGILVIYVIWDD